MMTSDDKVGGWVKKGQNHDDVIIEWSLNLFSSLRVSMWKHDFLQFSCLLNVD